MKKVHDKLDAPADAIKKIDAWLAGTGMAESRLGLLACANPRAVERIRRGGGTVSTLAAVLAYINRNPTK